MQDYASQLNCSQNRFLGGGNCWAEIDLAAIGRNARLLSSLGAELMGVVKADAYGHGINHIVPELLRQGISRFGVASAAEGVAAREIAGDGPEIYVMTPAPPQNAPILLRYRLTPFVSSYELLNAISAAAQAERKLMPVHLEVDTGIGRAGIKPDRFAEMLQAALHMPGIEVAGICTHFTWAENTTDAETQRELFERVLSEQVPEGLLRRIVIHAANSPATLNLSGARYGMIRPGLSLYGIAYEGSEAARIALPDGRIQILEPALSLRARVLLVRDLPVGAPISYGRTYRMQQAAQLATIGIGYGDGYSRVFSNRGRVLLPDGRTAPVRGRVCMDQVCVELPEGSSLAAGDVVTLVGSAGGTQLRAAEIAEWIDATPHEITTCLTYRVPRIAV